MTRASFCYFLLLLLHLMPDRVDGSSNDLDQYLDTSREIKSAKILARCTKRAASTLFEPTNRIIVIVDDEEYSITTNDYLKILSNDASSVTLMTSNFRSTQKIVNYSSTWLNNERNPSYVIISSNLENLLKMFGKGGTFSTWSEYLIVTKMDEDSLNIFGLAVFHRGYVRIAFIHSENNDSVILHRYDEKLRFLSTLDPPELKSIGICNISHENSIMDDFNGIEPFSDVLCPAKGCQLTVGRVTDDMLGSPEVAKTRRDFDCAGQVIDFFIHYNDIQLRKRINYDENLNWTKTVEGIERGEIDVAYGSFVPSNSKDVKNLDIDAWFDFETIKFLDVSRFTIVAPLTKIFVPLDAWVWLCLITLLAVYSLFAIGVKKAHHEKMLNESIKIFDIWAILLGQGFRHPMNIGLRAVLGMWMIAVLLINAAYGSAFSSSLAAFKRIETLKTLHDLNKSGKLIAGTADARELFNNSDDVTEREIYEKWTVVKSNEVFPVVLRDHIVGIDTALNVKLHNLVRKLKFQPPLYLLQEPVLIYTLHFYFKKDHPYIKRLHRLVIRARAAGLIHKWRIDDIEQIEARSRKYLRALRSHRRRTIRDMSVSFKTWSAGIIISLLTFFYEFYKSGRCRFPSKTKNQKVSKSSINDGKTKIYFS